MAKKSTSKPLINKTFDIIFTKEDQTERKNFAKPIEFCKAYIRTYNGTLIKPAFKKFSGGIFEIVCNETKEVEFKGELKQAATIGVIPKPAAIKKKKQKK